MRRKPNRKNPGRAAPKDKAKSGGVAAIPPEEFAGFDKFGEYPEFRPGDRAMGMADPDSEEYPADN